MIKGIMVSKVNQDPKTIQYQIPSLQAEEFLNLDSEETFCITTFNINSKMIKSIRGKIKHAWYPINLIHP